MNFHYSTDYFLREVFHAVLVAAEEAEGQGGVRAARRPALRQRSRAHGARRQQGHQGHHQQVRQGKGGSYNVQGGPSARRLGLG